MIYVASSWKNPVHIAVVAALRAAGIAHYDFRHPVPGNDGFSWKEVMPELMYNGHFEGTVSQSQYVDALAHPVAESGFKLDFEAMEMCDTCVLVLPSGRSSHLELGWFVGQGRKTAVLLDDPVTPELMYKMVDYIAPSLFDLLGWLGVDD
jgi:hypothetical protein